MVRSSACCALDSVGFGTVARPTLCADLLPRIQCVVTVRQSRPFPPQLNHTCCDASRHNSPKPHKTATMRYMRKYYTNLHTTNKRS